uniref:type I-C CRISPR-associated protein Cas8c/Csd1 n=1 Tax=Jutongia sp. TaxID=2944204 RepID=UPI00307A2877
MILQSLVGYYEYLAQQGKVSNPGWCMARVSYAIDLRQDGTIREILDLREERQMGKKPLPYTIPDSKLTRLLGAAVEVDD